MKIRILVPVVAICATSCAPRAVGPTPERPQGPVQSAAESEASLPALTSDEKRVMEDLRRHLKYLSGKVGERNENAPWELADAADYIAAQLEEMGLPVERQGYETRNVAAQNLAVTISGSDRGDQIFVVAAHYDSPAGDRGENAGGSATAALLSLIALMKDASLKRTLRFVFFSMGESPHGDGEARGARHSARQLAGNAGNEMAPRGEDELQVTKRAETVGLLHLDRLASFEPHDSKGPPLEAVVTVSPGSEVLKKLLLEDFDPDIFAVNELELGDPGEDSDLLAFHQQGIPGIGFRGTGSDGEAVQYEALARVVMQLRRGIGRILGERPTNDGMLTPLSEQIR